MARTPFPIRERNRLGGPVDIKNPKWVHQNLQIYGEAIPTIAAAFATDDPFTALGYPEDPFTRSIEKWAARPCQVDDSYLISYETYLEPAKAFCDFLADQYGLQVRCDYTMPGRVRAQRHYANWKKDIVAFDEMGNRLQPRAKPKDRS
ncbi:MAG: hypothetical protein ACO3WN_10225 [Burkholderiaceae bacterium]